MELGKSAAYSGPERRSEDALLLLIKQVHEKIDRMESALTAHLTDEPVRIAEEIKTLMEKAFPFGDPHGHRTHHEALIQKAEQRAEFWKKMSFELSRWGLLGFVGWVLYSLWKSFLLGPK